MTRLFMPKAMNKFAISFFICVSSFIFIQSSIAQMRKVALFDVSTRNNETNFSRIRSCKWILNTAGVEYDTPTDLPTALTYPIVFFSPLIQGSTFTTAEKNTIISYVNNGGVIICSSMQTTTWNAMCGVSGNTSSTTRHYFSLNTASMPIVFDNINDPNEITTRFGPGTGTTCTTRSYALTTGVKLGQYEDGNAAFVYNHYGLGHVYTIGIDLRDVVNRFQINGDGDAQRTYSNGFEPGSDVFMFLVQNIIRKHIPNTVRLHTSPHCSSSSIMITHDVDSKTAVDTAKFFADMEFARGIKATYNITTRYFADSWLSAFYNTSFSSINYIKSKGHVLASHSVGHFPDFSSSTKFPLGVAGLTKTTYHPAYQNGVTTGGTVFGEVQVSKQILETDHGVTIKTFRSGHLGYNKRQPYALAQSGYKFNSSFSANDVLTNYPFYTIDNLSFSGNQMPVLEIPMTISDASTQFPISYINYPQVVAIWNAVTKKNDANGAPTVLLVHPNRRWKVFAEKQYLDSIPSKAMIMPMEDFGEFWQHRDTLDFSTTLTNGVLKVYLNKNTPDSRLSFIIDNASQLIAVNFFNLNGQPLAFQSSPWSNGASIYCSTTAIMPEMAGVEEQQNEIVAIVYPNPSSSDVTIKIENAKIGNYTLNIYDALGQNVIHTQQIKMNSTGNLVFPWNVEQVSNGYYFFTIRSENYTTSGKLAVAH